MSAPKELDEYWKRILSGGCCAPQVGKGATLPVTSHCETAIQEQRDVIQTKIEECNEMDEIHHTLDQLSWNMAEMVKRMSQQQKQLAEKNKKEPIPDGCYKMNHGCNKCSQRLHCHCDNPNLLLLQENSRPTSRLKTVRIASPVRSMRIVSPLHPVTTMPESCHQRTCTAKSSNTTNTCHLQPVKGDTTFKTTKRVSKLKQCPVHTKVNQTEEHQSISKEQHVAMEQSITKDQSVTKEHSVTMVTDTISPEPCNDVIGVYNGCCCRPSSPVYIIQDQKENELNLVSEMVNNLSDPAAVQVLKDALDELSKKQSSPDTDLTGLTQAISDLKNQYMVTSETLEDRLQALSEKVTHEEETWIELFNRVKVMDEAHVLLSKDVKALEVLVKDGVPNPDLMERLTDISNIHEHIRNELSKVTIRMETLNNLDNTLSLQRDRLTEAEDLLKCHCDDENSNRDELLRKLSDIEYRIRNMENNRVDTDRQTDRLNDKLDSLNRNIQDQNNRISGINNELNVTMRDLDKQINRLEPQLERQRDMIGDLRDDQIRKDNDVRNLRDKLADLDNSLRRLSEAGGPARRGSSGNTLNSIEEVLVENIAETETRAGGGGAGSGSGSGAGSGSGGSQQQTSSSGGGASKGFLKSLSGGKEEGKLKSGAINTKQRRSSVLVMTT